MSVDENTPAVPCSACRGSGRVSSNLGGTRHEVPCPWCDGRGQRLREHDAQAHEHPSDEGPPPQAA